MTLSEKITALINMANTKTAATDETLAAAINTLVAGYGAGGDFPQLPKLKYDDLYNLPIGTIVRLKEVNYSAEYIICHHDEPTSSEPQRPYSVALCRRYLESSIKSSLEFGYTYYPTAYADVPHGTYNLYHFKVYNDFSKPDNYGTKIGTVIDLWKSFYTNNIRDCLIDRETMILGSIWDTRNYRTNDNRILTDSVIIPTLDMINQWSLTKACLISNNGIPTSNYGQYWTSTSARYVSGDTESGYTIKTDGSSIRTQYTSSYYIRPMIFLKPDTPTYLNLADDGTTFISVADLITRSPNDAPLQYIPQTFAFDAFKFEPEVTIQ